MNKRTHWNIAKLSVKKTDELFPEYKMKGIKKIMFFLGTIEPDLSIIQFVHPHFYERSAVYIYSKISEMNRNDKDGFFDEYKLGKMVHYLCDFCCYAHSSGGMGGITDHILYEQKINKYLIKNYNGFCEKTSQEEVKLLKYADIISYIDWNIKQYKLEKPCYLNDIEKSIEISAALIRNILCDVKSLSYVNQFFINEDTAVVGLSS